ncbi:mediator of RNA polymerase II transcription subunit 14-like isoform X2 [Ruditapes philippinarum]|uniref:mediator of RNA polymerase II transcription subunit 14-like isoform X2 n=1 Tax=Ruditapes philippinarum TaxID=129788 RepID=UPI00295C06EF|nr:mediator of RNA polymerase II transcription subunit 14-like isoform X2 [Ruditapes philippinarum]
MPPTSEGHNMNMGPGHMGMGVGTISLATLIDFIVQRTYHELVVLSEILPRKTDMERKIEIVQYASRTRQLFIRLLALVKWANSASKVDKCVEICNFLEQQSMWFVETADTLSRMSRETLVNARLPNFSLPCAIDVLTLGTYPRLPKCIREKIVPPDPITPTEKKQVLQRLNQVIQYRLVSCELPQQMRKLKIENGRVKFLVENEFQVTLTLMEDSPVIPWRLLDIDILVEDHETGDGKALVHSLQIGYIHRLAQSRLLDNDKPLHDLYRVLHSFCQSLQLEVLNSQTQKLIRERLGDSLSIDEYAMGKCLTVSYWKDHTKKEKEKQQDAIRYKLSVHVNEEDDAKQLCVSHVPSMLPDECRRIGLTIQSEHLSIEKLLMQTIEVRTRSKLKDLSYSIQRFIEGKCEIKDLPLALHVPVVYPCTSSEQLRITVDAQRGILLASLPSLELPVMQDLEETLNGDRKNIQKHLVSLRLQMTILRCDKSVNCLHTEACHSLPLVNQVDHGLDDLPKHRLYVPVPKQPNHYVVACVEDNPPRSVELTYHLLETAPCPAEGTEVEIGEDNSVKTFLKAVRLVPLDTFAFTNGPYTSIYKEPEESEIESFHRKRKLLLGEYLEPVGKKQKTSPYFVTDLVHVVAACEEKLPFVFLGEELKEQGILHTNIQVDKEAMGLVMDIIHFPDVPGVKKADCNAFRKCLLSCKVRSVTKPARFWQIEFLFTNDLMPTQCPKEAGPTQRVICCYERHSDNHQKTVKEVWDEWTSMCNLYSIVKPFSAMITDDQTGVQGITNVKSYNYKRLTVLYGPGYPSLMHVYWKCDQKQFVLSLGREGQASPMNPHVIMATQLQHDLNTSRSLSYVLQILHDTWSPMNSLHKLSSAVILGVGTYPRQSTQGFTVLPQSSTHVRISYRNNYCLDVHFRGNKAVAIRDGAYSLFDTSKATEGFTPIPMLKAFLGMFVDDSVTGSNVHRRSTTEDDNPPSPMVNLDNMDVFNISQSHQSTGSPGGRRAEIAPSPSTFIGTPSPGNILAAGSPSNPQLHVPSPGSFVPAPSPSSLGIHMQSPASSFISPQGMGDSGSPYPNTGLAMPSPGQRNWPNSPSIQPSPVSRHGMVASPGHPTLHSPQTQLKDDHGKASVMSPPSRTLPQRAWAASTPTLLSHEAFDNLLKQTSLQQLPYHVPLSPLERFLGCKFLRRHIARVILQEKHLTNIQAPEPGVNVFKAETLQFRVSLNSSTLQSLHMKIQPLPEYMDQWSQEEIQIFEKYFDLKVACPPYKSNSLTAFSRLLKAQIRILKDVIQIMRLELMPNQDRSLKWSVQLLLTVPPAYAHMAPAGTPAIVVVQKMILMLQLTRINVPIPQQQPQQQQQPDPQTITIPLLYNIQDNTITLVEKGPTLPNANLQQVSQHLKRFMERFHSSAECAIYPAVRELLTNLVLT